ncbi:Sec23/Sec24 trunk domain-containing protein [Myxozyma melibiosi]|uniref:Sec23/Sec24 trunk domain-containing protein n=1 Tax=Myxozyma melibiosi TaxID=54550 RepID=A0ABR1FF76_9ASCO
MQAPPTTVSPDDLAARLSGVALEQPVRRSKRPARVFHNLDSSSTDPSSQPIIPSDLPDPTSSFDASIAASLNGFVPSVPDATTPKPVAPGAMHYGSGAAMAAAMTPGRDTQPVSSGVGGNGRVDPDQIPSLVSVRESNQEYYATHVYPTMEKLCPPIAGTQYTAIDQGSSNPKFGRLTLCSVPQTPEMLATSHLPLGLVLQPLSSLNPGENEVPVLDFGESGPPRCNRCRAYINPFVQFADGGAKFVCNMCQFANTVPGDYYSPIDASGRRIDRDQRPELNLGSVDFIVPKQYTTSEPIPMRYLFAIDVSADAVNKSLPHLSAQAIRRALYGSASSLPEGCKIAIMTFDRALHFYNLSSNLTQAQMMVVSEVDDSFLPLMNGLFVDPEESRMVIESLLDRLELMFEDLKVPEPAFGAVLDVAFQALEATGGKVFVTLSALSTWGPGHLVFRDDPRQYHTEKEKALFSGDNVYYKTWGQKYAHAGVGLDLFVFPSTYCDLANVGTICELSGGELYYYPNFVPQRDGRRMISEFSTAVDRTIGYQAQLKVRCSNGLQVAAYYGNFYHARPAADLEFGTIDEHKSVVAMFKYDGKLDPKLDSHFQAALLYTTKSGQRRVRCHNFVAGVTTQIKEVVKFCDEDAVVSVIAKEAVQRMVTDQLKDIRSGITEKCVQILASYRKHGAAMSSPGQLILPEALKELSVLLLGLNKTKALRGGNVSSDMRVFSMRLIKSMPIEDLALYLYPRIFGLHNLAPEDGYVDPASGQFRMPKYLRASLARFDAGGVYVIDNGQNCYLWIHRRVNPNLLRDLFGPKYEKLEALDPYLNELPEVDMPISTQARNIMAHLASLRGAKALSIQLARQELDGAEYEVSAMMVEDRNNEAMNYVDYLCHIHKQIQLVNHS